MPLWFFFAFIEIRTAYTELKACLDEQLSQTCKEYSNNQRLKGDIEKAATAVLRGRRFFCEAVNLRRIDLDFKVRPLVPCSREFFPEMEKCAKPIRNEYTTGNSASGELCRYLFSVLRMRALPPSVSVVECSASYNFARTIGWVAVTTKLYSLLLLTVPSSEN